MILLLKISDFAGFLKVIFGEVFGHQLFFAVFCDFGTMDRPLSAR